MSDLPERAETCVEGMDKSMRHVVLDGADRCVCGLFSRKDLNLPDAREAKHE